MLFPGLVTAYKGMFPWWKFNKLYTYYIFFNFLEVYFFIKNEKYNVSIIVCSNKYQLCSIHKSQKPQSGSNHFCLPGMGGVISGSFVLEPQDELGYRPT